MTFFWIMTLNHPDLVKMDCEGAEYQILAAATGYSFDKIKYMALEFHEGQVDELHSLFEERQLRDTKHRRIGVWFVIKAKRKANSEVHPADPSRGVPANALCDHEFRVAWGAEPRDSTENPASAISGRERRTQKPRTAAARHGKARLGAILLPTEAKKTKRLPAHNTADEIPIVSKLSLIAAFITRRVRYNIAARPSASPRPRPSVAASIVSTENTIKAAAKVESSHDS